MRKGLFSNRGITLIEIIVGVVIVGVAAAMAAPRFQIAIDRAKFRSATRDVISMLREARSRSISEKKNFGVNFISYPAVVAMFEDAGASPDLFDGGDVIVAADTLSVGTGSYINFLWDAELTFPGLPVVFSPNGSASNGGAVWVICETEHSVCYTKIHILSATGRISVEPNYY